MATLRKNRGIYFFLIAMLGILFMKGAGAYAVENKRIVQVLAVEYKGTFPKEHPRGGETVKAYRWEPSTIILFKGEPVELKIFVVNGDEHKFRIEGEGILQISGKVLRGEETRFEFTPTKVGILKLICDTHPPYMVAELVVLEKKK